MTPPDTPFPYLPLFRFDGRLRPVRPVDQRDSAAHRDVHPVDGACAWFAAAAGRRGDPRIYRCDAARHRHRHLFVDLRVVVAPDLAWGWPAYLRAEGYGIGRAGHQGLSAPACRRWSEQAWAGRSEEHTSELQSLMRL